MDKIGELFAVTRTAAWIDVEHHVTLGRPDLLVGIEAVTVIGKRSAVNFQDKRVFLRWIEVRRFDNPAFNLPLVDRRLELELFRLAKFLLG